VRGKLTADEHARVAAAVAAAEACTDGEIAVVVAQRSDRYGDAAAHWAALAALAWLAMLSAWPAPARHLGGRLAALADPWSEPGPHALLTAALTVALLGAAAAYLLAALLLRSDRVRVAVAPRATKGRRVHARALEVYAAAVQGRTRARTGVLIYLSLAEHRAEIAAEAGIHTRVDADRWGEAMAALVAGARAGRVADGLADAVTLVGAVLAEHFPRSDDDVNELGDGVIEL